MTNLPPLAQLTSFSRPLSLSEYYHASVGTSLFTLEPPREVVMLLRGVGTGAGINWQSAIDTVTPLHPATRLRMVGSRHRASWQSDGLPPRLRIENTDWDASSEQGAGFIFATPLSLRRGPTIELIIASGPGTRLLIILRALHAVIDGRGAMLWLAELFRALRGEELLGSNAAFSDFDFRRSVGKTPFPPKAPPGAPWPPAAETVSPARDIVRRISLGAPRSKLLPRVVVAFATFAHRYSDKDAVFSLPVDLRGHVPGLLTTTNFCDMMTIRLQKGEGIAAFERRLREKLAHCEQHGYLDIPDKLKKLPMPWLDLLVSRRRWRFRKRPPGKTATITNLGRYDAAPFTLPGFRPADLAVMPVPGDVFATLACIGDRVEMMLGIPRNLADEGHVDDFVTHLRHALDNLP